MKTHRTELIALMLQARESTALLIAAAMRCCAHHGDSTAACEAMRQDCLATPAHLQADLLAHFQQTHPGRAKT
ncbi:hypothetical protein BLL52_3762 [Rhodoferax antarcticus ANT.BR]|uniref:Uncharacterized protein n=1 Tax=Rhodoferax antarcticus ANT.BR TaxID=1111071 RepID=A0A1Q8YAD4_9BURK|nr:hypothetical protein BLL52_3762 [Rhodoferax antarcticus ANT.BR]